MADGSQLDLTPLLYLLRAAQAPASNPEPQPDLAGGQYSSDQATKWIAWHSGKLAQFQSLGGGGAQNGSSPPSLGPATPIGQVPLVDSPQLGPATPVGEVPLKDSPQLGPATPIGQVPLNDSPTPPTPSPPSQPAYLPGGAGIPASNFSQTVPTSAPSSPLPSTTVPPGNGSSLLFPSGQRAK